MSTILLDFRFFAEGTKAISFNNWTYEYVTFKNKGN